MPLAVVTVGQNPFAAAWWMPVSKKPFRFAVAVDRRNHSLHLMRARRRASLNLLSFEHYKDVIETGYTSGRRYENKIARTSLHFVDAQCLPGTKVIAEADAIYELELLREVDSDDADHVLFVFDVVYSEVRKRPRQRQPLLFLGGHDLATVGERVRHRRRHAKRNRPPTRVNELERTPNEEAEEETKVSASGG